MLDDYSKRETTLTSLQKQQALYDARLVELQVRLCVYVVVRMRDARSFVNLVAFV